MGLTMPSGSKFNTTHNLAIVEKDGVGEIKHQKQEHYESQV